MRQEFDTDSFSFQYDVLKYDRRKVVVIEEIERKSTFLKTGFLFLFLFLLMICVTGRQTKAASIPQDTAIPFTDGSGNCLTYHGEKWYLTDASGAALSGVQYLKIKKQYSLQSGFYKFNSEGRLVQKKAVYQLHTEVHGVTFNGYYYTSAAGRFRRDKQGLVKLSQLKCGTKTFDGYYYVRAYGKLSATARIRKIKTKISGVSFNGYYDFNKYGKLLKAKKFRPVQAQTVGSIRFKKGSYYFGGKNGALVRQKGWVTYQKQKYYINANGRKLTDRWKGGCYLLTDGTIAKSQYVPDGTYVGWDGKKCAKDEINLDGLKQKIDSMTDAYDGTWSVYVKDLKTGDVMNYHDCQMYPASTIKAFCMASVYNQIKEGKMKETATVSSLLKNMITVSNNESFNELVRRHSTSGSFLSGASVINKYLKANGYSNTEVHSTLHPSSSAVTSNGSNISSAKDCGLLLERIYNGTCVSKSYSKKMLDLLLQQQRRSKIPAGVPSGTKVANKTGETSQVEHDIAIVYGEKTDYVLCVFSTGSSSAANRIKKISTKVYNYLN